MWLILFVLLLWCWFNYLPEHAVGTISSLREKAISQIDTWTDDDDSNPQEIINEPIIVTSVGSSSEPELSGDMSSMDDLFIIDSEDLLWETGAIITGVVVNPNTGSQWSSGSVWEQIDTDMDSAIPNTNTDDTQANTQDQKDLSIEPASNTIINIQIGWQTVIIDGSPDEDIIINANGYRIIVQKN